MLFSELSAINGACPVAAHGHQLNSRPIVIRAGLDTNNIVGYRIIKKLCRNVAMMMQRGLLERGGMSPLSKARSRTSTAGSVQLRCTTPVSLSQLEAAYAVFQLPVPSYAATAARKAQPDDKVEEQPASPQPNSAQNKAPQAQLSSESAFQAEEDVKHQPEHASVGAAAENGAAVPAYALQMDGPNDVLDQSASSTAAAATAAATAAAATTAGAAEDAQPEAASEPHKAQDHVAAVIAEQAPSAVHKISLGQSAELAAGAAATAGECRLA